MSGCDWRTLNLKVLHPLVKGLSLRFEFETPLTLRAARVEYQSGCISLEDASQVPYRSPLLLSRLGLSDTKVYEP